MKFFFATFETIIRRECMSLLSSVPVSDKDKEHFSMAMSILFRYYFEKYEEVFNKPHPLIKPERVREIAGKAWNDSQLAINSVDDYKNMIDQHFQTAYQEGCDYNIIHFFSGDIRRLRYYEVCY